MKIIQQAFLREFLSNFSNPLYVGFLLLFSYISFVPFYYLPPLKISLGNFQVPIFKYAPFGLVILIFGFFLIDRIRKQDWSYKVGYFDFFVGIYLIISVLGALHAEYSLISFSKFLYYTITGLLLYYIFSSTFFNEQEIKNIIIIVSLISAFVAFYAFLEFVVSYNFLYEAVYLKYNPYFSTVASTIGNNNMVGAYLVLCLPFALYLFFQVRSPRPRTIAMVGIFLIAISIVLTGSRGSWLGLIVLVFVYFYRNIRRKVKNGGVSHLILVLLCLILLAEVAGYTIDTTLQDIPLYSKTKDLLLSRGRLEELRNSASLQLRIDHFKTAVNAFRDKPIWGIGFGNLALLYEKYKDPNRPYYPKSHTTENMYLMWLAENGVLGLGAALCFLTLLMKRLAKAYKACEDEARRDVLLVFLSSFSGLFANMLTFIALYDPVHRMIFWIFAGIAVAVERSCYERGSSAVRSSFLPPNGGTL